MVEKKTTEDIIFGLQKIINPIMLLTAHYDTLSMFVQDCEYDGAIIDQHLDIIEDYYQSYNEATDSQRKTILSDLINLGVNPMYLSEFFITYEQDLEVMKQQDPEENKDYMDTLTQEINNPEELIKDVRAYANGL